ncbi:MAG: GmrSD restriction endonuclease domain-containing protein [Bacillota bacterium]
MKLEGAKIRSIYRVCTPISNEDESPLKINIPFYQRPYKWGSEEGIEKIELLIQDFFENYEMVKEIKDELEPSSSELEYFAGSVVTVVNDEYHDLIDGQQRITTIYLMNYIKFLLLREFIVKQLSKKAGVESYFDKLSKTARNLFVNGEKEINNFKNKIKDMYNNANMCSGDEREEKFKNLISYYKNILHLPEIPYDDINQYELEYTSRLNSYLNERKLSLKYNRDNFNDRLKKSMSSSRIKLTLEEGPKLEFIDEDIEKDQIIDNYLSAIRVIFDELIQHLKNEYNYENLNDSLEKTELLIDKINDFLKYLSFCVIQTTNTDDAYTLFEVLNDRALELDDLDLIKNMFYKEYCQRNKKETQELDKDIEVLEELWGEKIFTPSTAEWKKRFTAFLGSIYLTGDNHIRYSKNQKYRENIKSFLGEEYDNNYNLDDIKYNFKVFLASKTFLNVFEIKYQNKNSQSYIAEAGKFSITYKVSHMLRALKQNGVIAALFNVIMNNFKNNYSDKDCNKNFDMDLFENYLKDIITDYDHSNSKFKKVHECAFNLRKITLLANNYKLPREYAKNIIKGNNFSKNNIYALALDSELIKESKKEFNEWTNRWYKGNKDDLRIKILFLDLLRTDKENNKLKYKSFYYSTDNPENIHLDHFEPQQINSSNTGSYFIPDKVGHKNREEYVNQLGNFMILPSSANESLSNKPAELTLEAYNEMGIKNSWLVMEIDELLDEFSIKKNHLRIPTEEFFIERKKKLQDYFMAILNRSFNENEIYI